MLLRNLLKVSTAIIGGVGKWSREQVENLTENVFGQVWRTFLSCSFAETSFNYDKSLSKVQMELQSRIFCLDNCQKFLGLRQTTRCSHGNWVRQDRERWPFTVVSFAFLWAVNFQFSLVAVWCGFMQLRLVEYVGCIAMRSAGHLSAGWSVQRCI